MNDFNVIIITGSDRTRYELELPLKSSKLSSNYSYFYFDSLTREIKNPLKFFRKIKLLFKSTEKNKSVYLISNINYLASFLVLAFSSYFNCPIVMRVRGRHSEEYQQVISDLDERGLFLNSLALRFHFFIYKKFLLPKVAHFILISEWCRKEFDYKNNCSILYNCIDLDKFKKQEYRSGNYILVITDFRFRKKIAGLDLFFTRYSDFITSEKLRFKIAGSGFLLDDFKKKHSNIKTIEYMGKVKDVRKLLSNANLFMHLSSFDAYPTTVLEAKAIGVPILVNNCCGMLEQIKDKKTGFILDLNDEIRTKEKFIKLLNSYDLKKMIINNANKDVKKNNSPMRIGGDLEKILRKVYVANIKNI